MEKRKVSYVDADQINDNISRAADRHRELSYAGADDDKIEQAQNKLDNLRASRAVMRGLPNGSGQN